MVTEKEASMEGFQNPSAPGVFSRFSQRQRQPSSVPWPCLIAKCTLRGKLPRYIRTSYSSEVASIPLRLAWSFAGSVCVFSKMSRFF